MTVPLFPPMAVAPLKAVSRLGMTDRVTLHEAQDTETGHGAERTELDPLDTGPFPGLMVPVSAAAAEKAAARGIVAQWVLQLPVGTLVKPGLTATVERATVDETWTREIEITGVEPPLGVHVHCTAVDVLLNQ